MNIKESANKYIPWLDGLRAISILLVLMSHFGFQKIIPGGLGVNLFFFISGYIITRNLFIEASNSKNNSFSISKFYIRRLLRLYPPLILVIISIIFIYKIKGKYISVSELFACIFYYVNYFVIIFGELKTLPFGTLWSLAIEEHFYIFYAFFLSRLLKNKDKVIKILCILLLMVLFWRFILVYYFNITEIIDRRFYTFISTDARIDSILFGCLLSLLETHNSKSTILKRFSSFKCFLLAMLLILFTLVFRNIQFRETIRYSIQSISFFILFSYIIYSSRINILKSILELPILVWIGRISYSLYIWDAPIHSITKDIIFKSTELPTLISTVSLFLTFITSAITYYIVEIPIQRFRKRLHE